MILQLENWKKFMSYWPCAFDRNCCCCCCSGDPSRIGGAIVRHEARVGRDQATRPRHQPTVGGCERENSEIVRGQSVFISSQFKEKGSFVIQEQMTFNSYITKRMAHRDTFKPTCFTKTESLLMEAFFVQKNKSYPLIL